MAEEEGKVLARNTRRGEAVELGPDASEAAGGGLSAVPIAVSWPWPGRRVGWPTCLGEKERGQYRRIKANV